MTKWEYKTEWICHRVNDEQGLWIQDINKALNELGTEGWELVYFPGEILQGSLAELALFKRPKED